MNKQSKVKRILLLYEKLRKGEVVNKYELATEFGVSDRSIQRDIDDIRSFLAEIYKGEEVSYNSDKRGYNLSGLLDKELSGTELLVTIKILLESRAFTKQEMDGLINSLIKKSSENEKKFIKDVIGNEMIHYQSLQHEKPLLKLIWDLGFTIKEKQMIEIKYEKMNGEFTTRVIKPLSVVFSEYYFYLIAFVEKSKYQTPAFFRVDRIHSFRLLEEKFSIPESLRVEDGFLRKRTQFMYGGEFMTIGFKFSGPSLEAVLDKFPTAKIVKQLDDSWMIEAEVYGKGCIMWMLSQGEHVEVVSPRSLREEIIKKIQMMERFIKVDSKGVFMMIKQILSFLLL